jgi:hypothetical protein
LGLGSIQDAHTGTVTVVQRVDSSMRLNVHFHQLVGAAETRRMSFGPKLDQSNGLARYQLTFHPPVREVRSIALRSLQGDGDYALGHLVVSP